MNLVHQQLSDPMQDFAAGLTTIVQKVMFLNSFSFVCYHSLQIWMKVEMGMTMRYAHSLSTVGLGHSETLGMFSLRSDKLQPWTNPVETHYKNSLFALTLTKMLTVAN